VTEVELDIARSEWWLPPLLGRSDILALARGLGCHLTRISLNQCTLHPDFWPALEDYLPSLKLLQLKSDVSCQVSDMLSFCSKTTTHPVTIELCVDQYQELITAGYKPVQGHVVTCAS
jgi:hypothetical protein